MKLNFAFLFVLLLLFSFKPWGFYAHQKINRIAVYTLPSELIGFYKTNIDYVTENAINPDQRRYAVKNEAPKHFIDLDDYSDSLRKILPRLFWKDAVEKFGEDSLMAKGIVPWQIQLGTFQLSQAFVKKDPKEILRISADLGHYIADANVPLHTTKNYNGQLSNQHGIHGFWESRIPELYSDDYDLLTGQAAYVSNVSLMAWTAVFDANAALDSVLLFEKQLTLEFNEDKKYTIEERNGQMIKTYSKDFSARFQKMLDNQIEKRMRASIKMVGDLWYTAWVNAGQPDLNKLAKVLPTETEKNAEVLEKKKWLESILSIRRESDF